MPSKLVYATQDELDKVKKDLSERMDALKPIFVQKVELTEAIKKAATDTRELREEFNKASEAQDEALKRVETDGKKFTESQCLQVLDEVKPMISRLGTDTRLTTDALDDRITETDKAIRASFAEELKALVESIDAQMATMRDELTKLIELRASQAAENLAKARGELEATIGMRRLEADEDNSRIRSELAAEIAHVREEQLQVDKGQDDRLDHASKDLHARLDEAAARAEEHRGLAIEDTARARADLMASLSEYGEATNRHLADLDHLGGRLGDALSRAVEVPARQVLWRIPDAEQTLRPPFASLGQEYASYYSPVFHASGCQDLQLELRIFQPPTADEGTRTTSGNLALYLWASEGMQIAMRLFIGSRTSTLEGFFTERKAIGTKRLCAAEDQCDEADGSLTVGVEILESLRDVEPGEALRDPSPVAVGEPVLGALTYHRHTNNRLEGQVKKQVERLQARLVRRVEWLVENASLLPQHFGPVEPICSPIFGAAGVEGMQLLFYPNGYTGATEGFCSLFIFAPAGVTMKFRLIAGDQVRDSRNTFEESGAFGRANFCRFEVLPDPQSDTILFALEIDEVTQEIHAKVGAEKQPKVKGARQSPVESHVKLQRMPGKESLIDIKPLPGMWTAKAIGDKGAPPDGFHTFGFLKEEPASPSSKGKSSPTPKARSAARTSSPPPPAPLPAPEYPGAPGRGWEEAPPRSPPAALASTSGSGFGGSGDASVMRLSGCESLPLLSPTDRSPVSMTAITANAGRVRPARRVASHRGVPVAASRTH